MTPDIFKPLEALYRAMDKAYDETASQYEFLCRGCEDTCCRSLFFHHTFVEKAYLIHGFEQMDPATRENLTQKAKTYVSRTFSRSHGEPQSNETVSLKLICPLNKEGLCALYPYRPMICRLHGLPHELHRPDGALIKGPGCAAGNFEDQPYVPFDRTPFYREMARVEALFRQQSSNTGKIRLTIAQMLWDNPPNGSSETP
ncbi:hypothetical protein [Desulfospira joergensenii]|uniref:hypothetical protein n=1 Tax=Desulfospira joergensenii TaxID=53329 RepID=UPI0003B4BC95|nr:hypothetical protein [Desulfospira joergensenii]